MLHKNYLQLFARICVVTGTHLTIATNATVCILCLSFFLLAKTLNSLILFSSDCPFFCSLWRKMVRRLCHIIEMQNYTSKIYDIPQHINLEQWSWNEKTNRKIRIKWMKRNDEKGKANMKTIELLYGKCEGFTQQKYANAEFIVQTNT